MIDRTVKQLEDELAYMEASYAEELAFASFFGNKEKVAESWEAAIASKRALIEARKAQDSAPCELPYGVHFAVAHSGAKTKYEGSDIWE